MYAAACTGMYVRLAARCPWWPNGVSDVFIDQVTDTCIVFFAPCSATLDFPASLFTLFRKTRMQNLCLF